MTLDTVLDIPEMATIGDATTRTPQAAPQWPAGTRIISADSHWLEGDIWIESFPAHLKDHAPRMIFKDGGWETRLKDRTLFPPEVAQASCLAFECVEGIADLDARLRDLDTEGVEKELLFPQRLLGLYIWGDLEYREHLSGAYNHYMASVCARAPGRLFFAALPNYWNLAATRDSIQEIKALGASALMVPINPREDAQGNPIRWSNPSMDPFWKEVEASGLPLCFHIGENIPSDPFVGSGAFVLTQMQGFRPTWGTLTFGGIFDRFPQLKVVFVEGGISWVASALHDADMIYGSHQRTIKPMLEHFPSHYWFTNCYATFMTDPVGLCLLDRIGADRVMWSSDYPHVESTFGYTSSTIQKVFDATSLDKAQKILGHTALSLFNME